MIAAGETESRRRRRIGKYLVTGRIGRGGMGMVYSAYDEILEREVAIKTLTAGATLEAESRQRFAIEAKAAAKLQHPNILTVFELGEDRGAPYIAMELLPGVDLEVLLRSGETLLLQEKLEIVIQVCRGLAFAHDHGIVHRDVKPSNLRVLDDGSVKILDFGIAKLQGTGVTKTGMMVGTVHYMSPEQIRGDALDGRSDVFSVGVILYELLAGARPFIGDQATDIFYKIVHAAPAPLPAQTELGASQPRLQSIVDRALAKKAGERYPSATALGDALAEVLTASTRLAASGAQAQETLQLSRRLLKEGRFDECLRRSREVLAQDPSSLEARRVQRAATRELQRREAAGPAADDFPELEGTYQAPPTQQAPATGTVLIPEPAAPPGAARVPWLPIAAFAAALILGAALLTLRGRAAATTPAAAAGGAIRVPVRSQPPGAAVLLDGQDTGIVTDGELIVPASRHGHALLTFRKAGRRDESRTIELPPAAGESVSAILAVASASVPVVSDPAGASVALDGVKLPGATPLDVAFDPSRPHRVSLSLDGYAPRDVALAAGAPPSDLRVTLDAAGPSFAVTLTSSYPLDVSWRGRVLARGQASPRVTLPQGRQSLSLVAPSVFLRTSLNVDVKGDLTVAAPATGTLNIKASPDNCEVFVDGASVGYLPILDKPVAAGTHAVAFKWPDGAREQESVDVPAGRPAYVTGRRD